MILTDDDRAHFDRYGYVYVSGAFAADDAAAMRDVIWRELATRGMRAEFQQQRSELGAARGGAVAERGVVLDDSPVGIRAGQQQASRLRQVIAGDRVA